MKPGPETVLPCLSGYRLFLVDVDDTLYEEKSFVLSGFRAVAAYTGRWGIRSDVAQEFLYSRFTSHGRERIFDALLHETTGSAPAERIRKLVAVYREHTPEIAFYPGVTDTLRALSSLGRIWAVTDGLASVQRRKVAALGLDRWVERVIYCQAVGCPKPDPGSLADVVRHGARDVLLIGDRPDHDLALAARMGLDAVRVRTGRFRNVPNHPWTPVVDIPSFARLLG